MDIIEGGKKQVRIYLVIKKTKRIVNIMKINYWLILTGQ